jgi:hypothetical protein
MMIKRASAAIAVSAFGLALGAGASFADNHGEEIPCGAPAVPAVYDWVVTQPAVQEVSHLEYQWSLETEHVEWLWERVTTTEIYEWRLWVPNTETPDTQWSATSPGDGWVKTGAEKVVEDVPATPPSTVVEVKWVQQGGNDVVWLPEGQTPTGRWNKSNDTRTVEVPGQPAQTHIEYEWEEVLPEGHYETQESATSPGAGWEQGAVVDTDTQTETVWSETEPEGDGWRNTEESRPADSTYEYQWAAESPGDGWVETEAEPRKVVDVPAVAEVKEWVVIVPGTPAGEPCPVDEEPVDEEPVDEEPVDEEPVDEEPVDEEPVDEEPVDEPTDPEEVPTAPTNPPAASPKPASAVPQARAVSTASPTTLAHTGTELTLLWTGLGLVVVGAGLGAAHRRVARES